MTKGPRRRFLHKLYLVLLERRDGPSIRNGRSLWGLQRPMAYETGADHGHRITVPAGFVTDLASVPRLVWSFYPPDGPWVKAAVVHDFLYDTNGDGRWWDKDWIAPARTFTRAEADDILLEGMRDRGIGRWERTVLWLAVRLGGGAGWRRAGALKAEREALRAQISTAAPRPVAADEEPPAI